MHSAGGVPLTGPRAHLERWPYILDIDTPADLSAIGFPSQDHLARGLGTAGDWTSRVRELALAP